MESTYQGIRTYQAEFSQETDTKSLKRVKRSSGWIYLEKPEKVRWSYREPEGKAKKRINVQQQIQES